MAANPPLQHRAGLNYPPLLGTFAAIRGDGVKLTSSTLVVLEGSDSEIRLLGAFILLGPGDFARIHNESGASVTAQLWLVLADGSEMQVGADEVIADGAIGTFDPTSYVPREGDRLEIRFSAGNVLAQDGVRVEWSWLVVPKTYLSPLEYRKLTSLVFDAQGPSGAVGTVSTFLANFSAQSVNFVVKRVWPDGFEEQIGSGTLAASGNANSTAIDGTDGELNDDWKLRVEFVSLPAGGFVWAMSSVSGLANMAVQDW